MVFLVKRQLQNNTYIKFSNLFFRRITIAFLLAAIFATCWACRHTKNTVQQPRTRREMRMRRREILMEAIHGENSALPPSYTVAMAKINTALAPPPDYITATTQQFQ